jgi:adenylate cyclase
VPDHISRELVSHVRVREDGKTVLDGDMLIARAHRRVALCFIDICDFTAISSAMSPNDAVRVLDEFFTLLDNLLDQHSNVIKIKTIGDAYFAVAGLASASAGNDSVSLDNVQMSTASASLVALIEFCLDVQEMIAEHRFRVPEARSVNSVNVEPNSLPLDDDEQQRSQAIVREVFSADGTLKIRVRIGIHCGDVIAGIVGRKQPQYDVWGTACNMASRIESSAINGSIQVSQSVRDALKQNGLEQRYCWKKRRVSLKGIGRTYAYTLSRLVVVGRRRAGMMFTCLLLILDQHRLMHENLRWNHLYFYGITRCCKCLQTNNLMALWLCFNICAF